MYICCHVHCLVCTCTLSYVVLPQFIDISIYMQYNKPRYDMTFSCINIVMHVQLQKKGIVYSNVHVHCLSMYVQLYMYMYIFLSIHICLDYTMSWVRIPPEVTLIFIFPFASGVFLSFSLSFFLSTSPITSCTLS